MQAAIEAAIDKATIQRELTARRRVEDSDVCPAHVHRARDDVQVIDEIEAQILQQEQAQPSEIQVLETEHKNKTEAGSNWTSRKHAEDEHENRAQEAVIAGFQARNRQSVSMSSSEAHVDFPALWRACVADVAANVAGREIGARH